MTVMFRSVIAIVASGLMLAAGGRAQETRPLPDQQALFDATRENLGRAQREQFRYAYKERRSELHVNPLGSKVGTDGVVVYEVSPGPTPDVIYRRLIERDGKPVSDSQPERRERRSRREAKSSVDDIVDVLEFKMERREFVEGREAIVVEFSARPEMMPATREGRIARSFRGTVWVDEASREVIRVNAIATESLSFGYGLVARLNQGSTATLKRERVDGGLWLPSSLRFTGAGRAMLFRKLNLDYVVEWFDYKKVL